MARAGRWRHASVEAGYSLIRSMLLGITPGRLLPHSTLTYKCPIQRLAAPLLFEYRLLRFLSLLLLRALLLPRSSSSLLGLHPARSSRAPTSRLPGPGGVGAPPPIRRDLQPLYTRRSRTPRGSQVLDPLGPLLLSQRCLPLGAEEVRIPPRQARLCAAGWLGRRGLRGVARVRPGAGAGVGMPRLRMCWQGEPRRRRCRCRGGCEEQPRTGRGAHRGEGAGECWSHCGGRGEAGMV